MYRFLFVLRVLRTFFPSGWCFSINTLRPRAGFFASAYVKSINQSINPSLPLTAGARRYSHDSPRSPGISSKTCLRDHRHRNGRRACQPYVPAADDWLHVQERRIPSLVAVFRSNRFRYGFFRQRRRSGRTSAAYRSGQVRSGQIRSGTLLPPLALHTETH